MSSTTQQGHFSLIGLPATEDADDLSVRAVRTLRGADLVVYPGVQLEKSWIRSLDLEGRLVTGWRPTTDQLLEVLIPALQDGKKVVLLVQGDPAWFAFELGHRASALAVAARVEALGYPVTVLPGVGGITATCAAARLDLHGEHQPGGVLVTTPVGTPASDWASETVRALSEGRTVVALMAEKYTGDLVQALQQQGLAVDCWLGMPSRHPPRRLVLPRDGGEFFEVQEPTTIVLRAIASDAMDRARPGDAEGETHRALIVLVDDEKAPVERRLHPFRGQLASFDQIILVQDAGEAREAHPTGTSQREQLQRVLPAGLSWTWLQNSRTSGSAGCFNTGALHALSSAGAPELCTVVMVDGRSDKVHVPPVEVAPTTTVFTEGICTKLDELLMAGMFGEHEDDSGLDALADRLRSIGVVVHNLRPGAPGFGHQNPTAPNEGARSTGKPQRLGPALVEGITPPPPHTPFALYVGIISADPEALEPLLRDLAALRSIPSLKRIVPVVLENGAPSDEVRSLVSKLRREGHRLALVSEGRQREDAAALAFGAAYQRRPPGQVGIAQARTMLQRYLGELMRADRGSFAWVLDDDMRVDQRAESFLPWLPAFREAGVDALIGGHEGSSPNPPLNGIRVQLVDLWHNLVWLQGLEGSSVLPDRCAENRAQRHRFPDYYYDLSRKHTGHLESPHWLEPAFPGETVAHARTRLVENALGILSGAPLTRPVIVEMPRAPLTAARDSVNRGGCTFVLDHRTLTESPNAVVRVGGREARRSDMVWAIINRHHRGRTIKRVGFPVLHLGRVTNKPKLDLEKVTGEIVGSAFYGAFTGFLAQRRRHDLDFAAPNVEQICSLVEQHVERRLRALELSFYRIRGLTVALCELSKDGELDQLLDHLRRWFDHDTLHKIEDGVRTVRRDDFGAFLSSLPRTADDYASATVQVDFIFDQLQSPPG